MAKKTKKLIKSIKPAQPAKDFQTIIKDLQQFWMDWGCVLWQPYNEKLGAGTMNPATFLRVLGPEPWNVAYVEPSVRPDDGRYGENPNRMQQHTQFQVILKPDPGDPQEVYLRSLKAIGIDVHKHDIRFVEDNWTSPALGAWGLGWEVWLDGLEITQFTYFQQAGGLTLEPVSVEITYGLDRIAMALQGVQTVGNLRWNKNHSWGDMYLQGEREHSKYYFEVADVERTRQLAELYEAEAKAALEAGLLLPAYDNVLRTSHAFNVLDARGAIGVTERQAYFRRMRGLAAKVAEAYVADRQRQEFPWLKDELGSKGASEQKVHAGEKKKSKLSGPKEPADFLLEIGTEELPPDDIYQALGYLDNVFKSEVFDTRFTYKKNGYKVYATPRRLVVYVESLQPEVEHHFTLSETKGPAAHIAFDSLGEPTKALLGWAKQKGIPLDEIDVAEVDGGKYAIHRRDPIVFKTIQILADGLPTWISGLKFDKSIRWNESGIIFSRPIRWILAKYGDSVIPFDLVPLNNPTKKRLESSNASRGLRSSNGSEFRVSSPKSYFAALKKQGVLLDVPERRASIQSQIAALAKAAGGRVPDDPILLDEVTSLVEAPLAIVGEFDAAFLELPHEVLIAVMKNHQRYFPIEKSGRLLNKFIAVGNGDFDKKVVTAGNENVLRARFADAAYFIRRDSERPLEAYVEQLKGLTFQKDLGSMADKTKRIVSLVAALAPKLTLSPEDTQTAQRAAQLCKADLVTKMVIEMTSLQGVIGRNYALASGEPPAVAEAIFEHYLPRFAGDSAPKAKAGLLVGIADRLDTLAGLFAMGLEPTGAKDPFAQRRAAIGLVQNLAAWELDFELGEGIALAAAAQPVVVNDTAKIKALDFIVQRHRALLLEAGSRHDVVDAVLAAQGRNPAAANRAVRELASQVARRDWPQTLAAFSRCVRITRDLQETYSVDESVLADEAEKALFSSLQKADAAQRAAGSVTDFIAAFTPLVPAISRFFEDVMVMAEDEKLKRNRLGLLQRVATLSNGVADFSKLEGF